MPFIHFFREIFIVILVISFAELCVSDKRVALNVLSSEIHSSSTSNSNSPELLSSTTSTLEAQSYVIIIDAGSTGSRIHVHSYGFGSSSSLLPVIAPSINLKIQPGMSSFARDPRGVVNPLSKLIDFAKEKVPEALWSETPLHLQATAGLRSVTADEAKEILNVARKYLQEQAPFRFHPEWALVISGRQEGVNGWVATNYLAGTFHQALVSPSPASVASVGVVEMGGSSTQITFVPLQNSALNQNHLLQVSLAGLHYKIYTHSFLAYGQQAAQLEFQKKAIVAIEEDGNPCYPKGLRHSANGNFDACFGQISETLFSKQVCQHSTCSFNNVFQPQISDEQFYVIENFYYTLKFFGALMETDKDKQNQVENEKANEKTQHEEEISTVIQRLKAHGRAYCGKEWKDIKEQYSKEKESALQQYCFAAAFQSAFLERGFGFTTTSKLEPRRHINGKDIDWELGAALIAILNERTEKSTMTFEEDPIMRQTHPLNGTPVRMDVTGVNAWENDTSCTTSNFLILVLAFALIGIYCWWNSRMIASKKVHSVPCPPVIAQLQMRV